MATSTQSPVLTTSIKVYRDTAVNATKVENINSGAATLYAVKMDNSANSSTATFFKLYDATSITVGTTTPNMTFKVAGGATTRVIIPKGISFATGISYAAVTDGGGTAGTTAPTNAIGIVLALV